MSDMATCGRCGQIYGLGWEAQDAKPRGCPSCNGVIGYPRAFYDSPAYKAERKRKRAEANERALAWAKENLTPRKASNKELLNITLDLGRGDWRDGAAAEMVEMLLRHIAWLETL